MTKARNLANFVAITGDLTVADKVVHEGDTNTAIRFPAADTVTVETSGAERMRIDSAGNLLLGTTTDFTSTTTAGGMALTGYGVYPFTTASTGTANTTALSSLNVTSNLTSTGSASAVLYGSVFAPTLSNDGTGGSNSTQIIGVIGQPAIGATGSSARVAAVGIVGQVDRGNAADFSTNSSGFYQGATFSARHLTTLPSTAVAPRLTGAVASASNFSGTATAQAAFVASVQSGSNPSSQNTAATTMAAFEGLTFTVGAATSPGTATVTDGYGVKLVGPTVAATGTMTNYYAFRADSPTVTGTLTNRYGIWINDPLSTNYFAGNVGIGTTSPSKKLHLAGTAGSSAILLAKTDSGASTLGQIGFSTVNGTVAGIDATAVTDSNNGALRFWTTGGSPQSDVTSLSERARITDAGTLLIGRTVNVSATTRLGLEATSSISGFVSETGVTTTVNHGRFYNPNGNVGNISTTNSATTYATSSDYRLKENVAPMQNALDTVAQLNPVTYTWKADGSAGQGFIAHELQAVVPDCVTGEKDAVDAEGNPQYQGVDTSFLVATLVAALQELKAEVDSLRAQLNP